MMLTHENIKPRRIFAKKCQVCKRNLAIHQLIFDYGYTWRICDKDYIDLSNGLRYLNTGLSHKLI